MKTADWMMGVLEQLAEVRQRCPEMRFGQILATVGLLAEDETGHSLWDVDDADFAVALGRFAADLSKRPQPAPVAGSDESRNADVRSA